MKFEIEMKEFWIEEDELNSALKSAIIRDVVKQINEQTIDKVNKEITEKVNEMINGKLSKKIDEVIEDCILTGTIQPSNRKEPIPIIAHVRDLFMRSHGWSSPTETLNKIAKKFTEDLKLQYNNIFAAKVVHNMREQGFLKDDVSKMLLENTESN